MSTQSLGKVSVTLKDTWNASTSYAILDIVNYNGSGYIAKKASTNITPTNTEYWLKLADKGDTGVAAGFGTPTASATSLSEGSTPTATVTASGEDIAKVFSFVFGIPTGATGDGISSISKTSTSGLVDTYTVTYTSGNTATFTVTNGAKGDTGTAAGFGTPTISVDSNTGTPYAEVTASGSDTAKIFSFSFHNLKGTKGDTGNTGATGNGIQSVTLNADYTLTILYTNGTSVTTTSIRGATGATGNGISSIAKTGTSGNIDTYTITMTDSTTATFTVTNANIDDTAGDGDTTKTWSADKLYDKFASQSSQISAKYTKPADGIPKTDLASGVQTSLEKADTALQTHQDISGKVNNTTTVNGHPLSANVTIADTDIAHGTSTVGATLTSQSSQIEELQEPHPYAYDGVDLKAYFGNATALHTALRAENYSHIHNGDYYPVTFSGTYRDYGEWVALSGTSYYSDTACTQKVGELSEDAITTYDDASPAYYKVTVSGTSYYVKMQDCQRYREKSINSLAKMEANINPYWEYGDSGELSGKKPHICWIARDGITTAKFRSTNQQWADAVEQFETGDGSTATYTPSDSTLTCVRYVCVNGTLKTYNTHYTVNTSTGAVTFKTGSIPAAGDAIIISRTTHDNPWVGSAIYKTLNDADYGLMQLIDDSTFTSFILDSMRFYGETRSVANSTSGAWANRGKGFLPTEPEVWGEVIYGIRNSSFLPQLPIFSGGRRHIMKGSSNGGSRNTWWVASSTSVVNICYVFSGGYASVTNARVALSLVPGFVSC